MLNMPIPNNQQNTKSSLTGAFCVDEVKERDLRTSVNIAFDNMKHPVSAIFLENKLLETHYPE